MLVVSRVGKTDVKSVLLTAFNTQDDLNLDQAFTGLIYLLYVKMNQHDT